MVDLNKKIIEKDNEITQVRITLNFSKEKARNNHKRMEIVIKELIDNCLVFKTLRINFDNA